MIWKVKGQCFCQTLDLAFFICAAFIHEIFFKAILLFFLCHYKTGLYFSLTTTNKLVLMEQQLSPPWAGTLYFLFPHLVWVEWSSCRGEQVFDWSPQPISRGRSSLSYHSPNQTLPPQPPSGSGQCAQSFRCNQTLMPAVIPCSTFTWFSLHTYVAFICHMLFPVVSWFLADPVSIHQHRSIGQIFPFASLHDTFAINFFCLCFLSTRFPSPLIHSGAVWKWFWRLSCSVQLPIGDILHSPSSSYKKNTVIVCEGKKEIAFLSLYCADFKNCCFGGQRWRFLLLMLLMMQWGSGYIWKQLQSMLQKNIILASYMWMWLVKVARKLWRRELWGFWCVTGPPPWHLSPPFSSSCITENPLTPTFIFIWLSKSLLAPQKLKRKRRRSNNTSEML